MCLCFLVDYRMLLANSWPAISTDLRQRAMVATAGESTHCLFWCTCVVFGDSTAKDMLEKYQGDKAVGFFCNIMPASREFIL